MAALRCSVRAEVPAVILPPRRRPAGRYRSPGIQRRPPCPVQLRQGVEIADDGTDFIVLASDQIILERDQAEVGGQPGAQLDPLDLELPLGEHPCLPSQLGAPEPDLDIAHRTAHLDVDRLAQLREPDPRLPQRDHRPLVVPAGGPRVHPQRNVQTESDAVVIVDSGVSLRERPAAVPEACRGDEVQLPLARVVGDQQSGLRVLDAEQRLAIVRTMLQRRFHHAVRMELSRVDAQRFRRADSGPAVDVQDVDQGETGIVQRIPGFGQAQLPLRDVRFSLDDFLLGHSAGVDQDPVDRQPVAGPLKRPFPNLHLAHGPDDVPVRVDGPGHEADDRRLEGEEADALRPSGGHDVGGADRGAAALQQRLNELDLHELVRVFPIRHPAVCAEVERAPGGDAQGHPGHGPECGDFLPAERR